MSLRQEKVAKNLKQIVSSFLETESNRSSLITVAHIDISPDLKNAKIFVSVLPENKKEEALEFCTRKSTELRSYVKKHSRLKMLPFFTFKLDRGEQNRQRIFEMINEKINPADGGNNG